MTPTRPWLGLLGLLPAALLPAQQDQPKPELALGELIAAVQKLEADRMKNFTSAVLKMRQKGQFPDGSPFELSGTIRVLGKTHVHEQRTGQFGEDFTSEVETVVTPEGVWTREKDPTAGEVFTFMRPEMLAQLKEAAQVTGRAGDFPGTGAAEPLGPAAGQMLTDLSKLYDFTVNSTKKDARDYWVVRGVAKKKPEVERDPSMPDAEELELLISKSDAIVTRMAYLRDGKPFMTVEVQDVVLDQAMDEKSFKIPLPANAKWRDVKDHPAAWAQIQTLLDEAKAKREEGKDKEKEKSKETKEPGK